MKVKGILRFYFCADFLNEELDKRILKQAFSSSDPEKGGRCADRIINIISEKQKLAALWQYLDGVMQGFGEDDRRVLYYYGVSAGKVPKERRNAVRRVTVRFFRHANRLCAHEEGVRLAEGYYFLMCRRLPTK